jgi:hypothetical protein
MGNASKTLALSLTFIIALSCLTLLTVKPVNAQSTPSPEITILYPTNGTFFNVSMGVNSFQLKYTTNNPPLSWIGYSIDGGQNRTAYGAWFNIDQISYDEEGNPSVRVSGVFESDGNHNLTLYTNNTSGDWAIPQTVSYVVNINADTTIPPTTSNPTTTQSTAPSPTLTSMPTINTGSLVESPPIQHLVAASGVISFVILSFLLYRRHRKTANMKEKS